MQPESTFCSFEQPLDLTAQSTVTASRVFEKSFSYDPCSLTPDQITMAALYRHNPYSLTVIPPVDYSYKKQPSLTSPGSELEFSPSPGKAKRSPSVGSTVDKASLEYRKKRIKNNEAARKSRQKKKESEVEKNRKMKILQDEVLRLTDANNAMKFLIRNQKCLTCCHPLIDSVYNMSIYDRMPSSSISDH